MALRTVPTLTDLNDGFWTFGRTNDLYLRRCEQCAFWIHPPRPMCPRCRHRELRWEATTGKASLFTFTVNHKAWNPEVPVPYVVAIVELPEQEALRMTSNIVNCDIDDISIGMALRVTFEQQGELFIPLFEPDISA
jgi:uncharacterized protein